MSHIDVDSCYLSEVIALMTLELKRTYSAMADSEIERPGLTEEKMATEVGVAS
jgi:hypothetical protein